MRLRTAFTTGPKRLVAVSATTWAIVGYFLLLVEAQLSLVWGGVLGVISGVIVLTILLAGALRSERLRRLSISLAIIPLAQLACSTIVTHNNFQSAAVFYGMILLLAMAYRYMFTLDVPLNETRMRLTGYDISVPLMLVVGQLLGVIGYGFLRNHYAFEHISLPLVLLAAVVFGFAEEMLLRGLIQQQAARLVHPALAALLTAMLYASLMVGHDTLLTVGPAVAMGTVLSAVYYFKPNVFLTAIVNVSAKLVYIALVATFVLR